MTVTNCFMPMKSFNEWFIVCTNNDITKNGEPSQEIKKSLIELTLTFNFMNIASAFPNLNSCREKSVQLANNESWQEIVKFSNVHLDCKNRCVCCISCHMAKKFTSEGQELWIFFTFLSFEYLHCLRLLRIMLIYEVFNIF